ncbi:MAG: hypothetical protein ACM31C_26490 [Acidobacteriota bacterium]
MRRWLVVLAACSKPAAPPSPPPSYVEVSIEHDAIAVARVPDGELELLAAYDWRALETLLSHEGLSRVELGFAVPGMIYRDMVRGMQAARDAGYDVSVSTWFRDLATHTRARDACAPGMPAIAPAVAPCALDERGDADGDGALDCWRVEHDGAGAAALAIRPGCRGDALRVVARERGISQLELPPALATPGWQRWIAARLVGAGQVSSTSGELTPAWRWWLARHARDAAPGVHGTAPPSWEPIDSRAARPNALVIDGEPRVVVDPATRADARDVECGDGLAVVVPGGIAEYDAQRAQLRWLYRGPGAEGIVAMTCVDDVLVARGGGATIAVDVASGGWLCDPGAHVYELGWAFDRLHWQRVDGTVIAIRDLAAWLRRPLVQRGDLDDQHVLRPELVLDPRAEAASRAPLEGPLPASFPRRTLPAGADAPFEGESLPCQGWMIRSSSTAILATRRGRARWVVVEPADSPYALSRPRCEQGRLRIDREGSELGSSTWNEHVLSIDLRRGGRTVD